MPKGPGRTFSSWPRSSRGRKFTFHPSSKRTNAESECRYKVIKKNADLIPPREEENKCSGLIKIVQEKKKGTIRTGKYGTYSISAGAGNSWLKPPLLSTADLCLFLSFFQYTCSHQLLIFNSETFFARLTPKIICSQNKHRTASSSRNTYAALSAKFTNGNRAFVFFNLNLNLCIWWTFKDSELFRIILWLLLRLWVWRSYS